jgi:hypothetical protein
VRHPVQRLLAAQAQDAEPREAVIKKVVHALLQWLREVDHHVAAQDHIEFVEGAVHRQVVLREEDVLLQRGAEDRGAISSVLSRHNVSLESVLQKGKGKNCIPLIIVTHKAHEAAIRQAIAEIEKLPDVVEVASCIRVEE